MFPDEVAVLDGKPPLVFAVGERQPMLGNRNLSVAIHAGIPAGLAHLAIELRYRHAQVQSGST